MSMPGIMIGGIALRSLIGACPLEAPLSHFLGQAHVHGFFGHVRAKGFILNVLANRIAL